VTAGRAQQALWVVGMPRSGTTLLRTLLGQHPDIGFCDYESKVVPALLRHVGDVRRLQDPATAAWVVRQVRKGRMYLKSLETTGWAPSDEALREALTGPDWSRVIRSLLTLFSNKDLTAVAVWGDKTATYADDIDLLAAAIPSSRFVFCVRDPRDQALSAQAAWGKSLARSADSWRRRLQAARVSAASHSGAVRELRYEDLVADPAAVLDAVCGWLGLAPHPWALQAIPISDRLGESRELTYVSTAAVGARRHRLSRADGDRIAALAGPAARELGYDLAVVPSRRLPRPARAAYATSDRMRFAIRYLTRSGPRRGARKITAAAARR
jgi:hypothetical protein